MFKLFYNVWVLNFVYIASINKNKYDYLEYKSYKIKIIATVYNF